MKRYGVWIAALVVVAILLSTVARGTQQLFDVSENKTVPLAEAVPALKANRILLVGELHTSAAHHENQLAVIRTLHEAGVRMVIGMEMFRSDSQADLDRWSAGALDESDFIPIYLDNWNFDWRLYAPLLRYARDNRIPVKGLNVSRAITSQVARQGFESLTDDQRGKLDGVTCRVDQTYMDFIQQAYGAHAHGELNFTYFCEAQLVWDTIMAINALETIRQDPKVVMVIVAGNGHAWKGGIPAQLAARSAGPVAVILPEIPGTVEPGLVDREDADYLFLK